MSKVNQVVEHLVFITIYYYPFVFSPLGLAQVRCRGYNFHFKKCNLKKRNHLKKTQEQNFKPIIFLAKNHQMVTQFFENEIFCPKFPIFENKFAKN
jgi:hypothetical protein